ncbi:Heme-binding protein A [Usitatibacter rugosus]|uniref:Heme-binding protein A n=1 Tax=Usitatibacter rugosus TaxID=2732067 RepID=A0A6M4GYS6_9PROT|nr:ABC transporter substrate-binding protein [Usitatibacter rugosus]QJR11664.1 Heme-binding protein A [Usitatibacter rugosus]
MIARVLVLLFVALSVQAAEQKVLRIPFIAAETNFDPAFTADLYSNNVIDEILEPPLTYDMLARPAKLKPQTLEAMPEITEGGRLYTLRIKKGIYFADDAVFKGTKRELVAQDYIFAIQRLVDPKMASPNLWMVDGKIEGLDALRDKAKKEGRLDYDAPISGLKVLDRYTLQIHLTKPDYNFLYILALGTLGAQCREVVEHYGSDIGAHPIGTGPFMLKEWKRSSKIVLERNPNFREVYYEAEPAADDAEGQRILAEMKGKRLPAVDRVEIYIIEESQPRWLAFLNSELEWINQPYEFKSTVLPGDKLAPWAVKRGLKWFPSVEASVTYVYYNMKDPVWGGYTPEKVALRRAVGLGYDIQTEINLVRNGTAIEAVSPIPPGVLGYDASFNLGRSYDPAKAKALLDMFGYVDKDGDGWRDLPDGKPLIYEYASAPSQLERQFLELRKKSIEALGIRVETIIAKWPDLRKRSKLGKLQSWFLAWNGDFPDGENFYQLLYGPNCGSSNDGCFQFPEFDRLYEQAAAIPPTEAEARKKIYQQMARIVAAYQPWSVNVHRKRNDLTQPWVLGWRKNPFLHEAMRYADIDLEIRAKYMK